MLRRRRRLDALVADLVKEAVGDGDLRPDIDPAVTARLMFGMVNSLTEWLKPGKTTTTPPSPTRSPRSSSTACASTAEPRVHR